MGLPAEWVFLRGGGGLDGVFSAFGAADERPGAAQRWFAGALAVSGAAVMILTNGTNSAPGRLLQCEGSLCFAMMQGTIAGGLGWGGGANGADAGGEGAGWDQPKGVLRWDGLR